MNEVRPEGHFATETAMVSGPDGQAVGSFLIRVVRPDRVEEFSYVDWVANEYASGDFSLVHAYSVGHSFAAGVQERTREMGRRFYTVGRRENAQSFEWQQLGLVQYRVADDGHDLEFTPVA